MGITYKLVEWRFNWGAWASALKDGISQEDLPAWAQLLGVHEHTLANWQRGVGHNKKFPYPNMTNFLTVCNALEFNPADFFEAVEALPNE